MITISDEDEKKIRDAVIRHHFWFDRDGFVGSVLNAIVCLHANQRDSRWYMNALQFWYRRVDQLERRNEKLRAIVEAGKQRRRKLHEEIQRLKINR